MFTVEFRGIYVVYNYARIYENPAHNFTPDSIAFYVFYDAQSS